MIQWFVIGLVGLLVCVGPVQALEMGMITAQPEGTYYQIGQNLRTLLEREGITLTVYPSSGSLENVEALYKRPNVQFGITQADVLGVIATAPDNRTLQRLAQKTKLVFPLYNEEVHLVASRASGITELADLEDKTVAMGKEESGTFLTAHFLLKLADVRVKEEKALDGLPALEALRRGDVDAMFYVAGYPVTLFREAVTSEDKVRLVPITEKSLTEFYALSAIPAGTYPWQTEEVTTVAVKAVLITFDYQGETCQDVGRVAKLVYDNLGWLQQQGHPKWRSVDLSTPLRHWEQSQCVTQGLGGSAKSVADPASQNPIVRALKNMLKEPLEKSH